jgi:putative transposase
MVEAMPVRGETVDNAVAESFFQLLKRERIRKRIYITKSDARSDVFDYIDLLPPQTPARDE